MQQWELGVSWQTIPTITVVSDQAHQHVPVFEGVPHAGETLVRKKKRDFFFPFQYNFMAESLT